MRAEIKKENGREVYKRKDKSDFIEKVKIGALAFIAGVTMTLMFYPLIRPLN